MSGGVYVLGVSVWGGGEEGLSCHQLGYPGHIKIVGPNIKLVFLRTLP